MSNVLANLSVLVFGDINPLEASLRAAETRMRAFARRGALAGLSARTFGRSIGAAGRFAVAPITDAFQKAGAIWRNSLTIGAVGAAGATGFAVKTAMDLEHSYTQIAKASPWAADSKEIAQLKAGIEGFATDADMAGVSMETLLSAANTGAKLGIGEQGVGALLDYTKGVSMLSLAFDDLPMEDVANNIGILSTIFNQGADHARFLGSAVDALSDASVAGAAGLFDVAQRAASAGKAVGLTEGQVLGLSTALLQSGMNAEAAGSSLMRILGEIATAGPEFATTLGMDPEQFAALDAMGKVKATIAALSQQPAGGAGFAFLAELGFDATRDRTALLNLANAMAEVDRFTAIANRELATGAHLQKSVSDTAGKAGSSLTQLWNQILILADKVGAAFLPAVRGFSGGLSMVAEDARAWVAENEAMFRSWGESLASAFTQAGTIVTNWDDWMTIGKTMLAEWSQDIFDMLMILVRNLAKLGEMAGQELIDSLTGGITDRLQGLRETLLQVLPEMVVDQVVPDQRWTGYGTVKNGVASGSQFEDIMAPLRRDRAETTAALEGPMARIAGTVQARQFGQKTPQELIEESMKAAEDALLATPGLADLTGRATAEALGVKSPEKPQFNVPPTGQFVGPPLLQPPQQAMAGMAPPGGSLTGQTLGLPEYAQRIQEGVFKKDEDKAQAERKLARKAAEKQVKELEKANQHLAKMANGASAVAVAPA